MKKIIFLAICLSACSVSSSNARKRSPAPTPSSLQCKSGNACGSISTKRDKNGCFWILTNTSAKPVRVVPTIYNTKVCADVAAITIAPGDSKTIGAYYGSACLNACYFTANFIK